MMLNSTPMPSYARHRARPARAEHRRGRNMASAQTWSPWAALAELFTGVEWSPALVAFLYYYFVVVTYWLPGADVAMVIAVATMALHSKNVRLGRILRYFLAFVAWCWVAYLANEHSATAFDQTWALTKVWVIAFVGFNVLRTRSQIRFFLAFASACFVFFPLRGAFVNYLGGETTFGRALWNYTYANPNDLAAFTLLFASMNVALLTIVRNRSLRLWAFGTFGLMILLILFTQSRAALLAAALVMGSVIVTKLRNPRVWFGTVATIAIAAFFAPKSVWNRLGGLSNVSMTGGMHGVDVEGSAEQRFQIMQIAARVAADNPVVGVGIGSYRRTHYRYAYENRAEFPLAGGFRDAHNTYLITAAETGLTGLAFFLVMLFSSLRMAVRTIRSVKGHGFDAIKFLNMGLIAFLLAGFFGSFSYLNMLYLHLVLIESLSLLATPLVAGGSIPRPASPSLRHHQQ